jgi:hypothetical protein
MNPRFDIEISGDLVAAIPRIKDQDGYLDTLRRAMDAENQLTIAQIQRAHLSGPTTDSSLSVRTNRLRSSVNASKAIIVGSTVWSAIGSNVKYAKTHEFGALIQRTVKAGEVRLLTNKDGKLLMRGNLATFARSKNKLRKKDQYFKRVKFEGGKSYTITIPARAPFGHGIADRLPSYTATFELVTEKFLHGQN